MFISTRARISPTATIEGPAWIGPQVIIGPGAHILPGTIIESAAYIDRQATVRGSWIGPKTYVGAITEVSHSFAWGTGLENWRLDSFIEITDDFLLASSKHQPFGGARSSWVTRLLALLLMLLTSPIALSMAWDTPYPPKRSLRPCTGHFTSTWHAGSLHTHGRPPHPAEWPHTTGLAGHNFGACGSETCISWEIARSPQRLHPCWEMSLSSFGSPHPAPADAANDGLNDAESALAHAAYYSAHRSFGLNLRILLRCLPRFLGLRRSHDTQFNSYTSNNTTAYA